MVCQLHDVETQRRDVTKACVFEFFQCCDVTERVNLNFFTKLSKSEKTP